MHGLVSLVAAGKSGGLAARVGQFSDLFYASIGSDTAAYRSWIRNLLHSAINS
jgi:hypothetical protein